MFKKKMFIQQQDIMDCGASCLAMIIKYYKGYLPLEEVKKITHTTTKGTSAYHLINGAKEIGFSAKGVNASLKEINKDNLILPCIAHLKIDDSYTHFVVVTKIDYAKQKITIMDPAKGEYKISYEDFNDIWTKVLIILYPEKTLPHITNNSLRELLFKVFAHCKTFFIEIFLLSCLYTIFSIVGSFYFKYVIDDIIMVQNYDTMFLALIIFVFVALLKNISDYFRNKLVIYANQKIDIILNADTFKHIISLPYQYYRYKTSGEIISRITDISYIREMITQVSVSLFVDFILLFGALFYLYILSPELWLIALGIFLSYILIYFIFSPLIQKRVIKNQELNASTISYMYECVSGFETVKGLSIENYVNKNFENKYVKLLNNMFKLNNNFNNQSLIKNLINSLGIILLLYWGAYLVMEGNLSIGSLISFNSVLLYFLEPLENILNLDGLIKNARSALKRIKEMLYVKKEESLLDVANIESITYKNLDYSYNDYDNTLHNINLTIEKEDKIMIIGSSGSGKSTLMKLLLKYYDLKRNVLFVNNSDITDLDTDKLKSKIVYISQNETLFTTTVYDNIVLDLDVTSKKVNEITKLTYVDEILASANLNYNSLVEENGFNFSGGEKQRLILARALIRSFDVLIIDEGLNQVDTDLERKILKNIFNTFENKIIIYISHRLENMDLFKRVIHMEDGQVLKDINRCS